MAHSLHFNVMIAPPSAAVYTHTTSVGNTTAQNSILDQSLANSNPNAMVFIMPRHTSVRVTAPLSVWYNGSNQRWTVFSQNVSALPLGLRVNVFVTQAGPRTFVHEAVTGDNIVANHTFIDHRLTNNNPNANHIVTQNWNPGGGTGVYNESHVGVFCNPIARKWAIFNQDEELMPNGASFNVMVGKPKLYLPFVIR